MAIALGAKIIEKHVTLDNLMDGPDHRASENIENFSKFVENVRRAEIMLGNGKKDISKSASKNKKIVMKSIYAKSNIKKNDSFSVENLVLLRPAGGIPSSNLPDLIGKNSKKEYFAGEAISITELR